MNIVVYGRSVPYCSFCEGAKKFLEIRGLKYTWVDIVTLEPEQIDSLREQWRSVPIIYIDDILIGGLNELQLFFKKETETN